MSFTKQSFHFQRIHETETHWRWSRDERIPVQTRPGSIIARLSSFGQPASGHERSGFVLQQPSSRHQLGLPTPSTRHHRTTQVQHAALSAIRAQLPEHAGEPCREGALVRDEQADVRRGAAPHVKVSSALRVAFYIALFSCVQFRQADYSRKCNFGVIVNSSVPTFY